MNKAIIALIAMLPLMAEAHTWTLDSCINYAIDHNINVRSSELNRLSGELAVTEAKDRFLPELSAGAQQAFNFGRGLTSDNTYANRNTSNFGWNIGLNLPLFQGLQNVRQLKYQQANLRTLIEREAATRDDVTLNVISQYLQVLYCTELVSVAQEQLHMSDVELQRRRELLDAGKIAELDVTQAVAQKAQDELQLVTATNNRMMALVDLAQLLQLPDVDGFDISPITDDAMPLLSADQIYANALQYNHGIRASRLAVEAADQNIRVANTGYFPRLSFNAGLSGNYYRLNGIENPSFSEQMRQNFNKSIGFTLSIPIFDKFSTRNAIKRARVEKLNAELQLDDAQTRAYQTIQHAYYDALGAEKKLKSSTTAREATHAALLAMQEKYNYGRANATEYEQAKSDYIKSASEAIQAKYEWLLRLRILNFYNRTN